MTKKEDRMSDSPPPVAAKVPLWVDCQFETGFARGEDQVTKIRLRKPTGGELRGLNLQSLLSADADAIIKILPRISDPILTIADAEALEANDFAEAADAITGFFLSAGQKKMVEELKSRS